MIKKKRFILKFVFILMDFIFLMFFFSVRFICALEIQEHKLFFAAWNLG